MGKIFYILLIIILAVIFEVSVLPLCFPQKYVPDFVLVVLVSATVVFGFKKIWIWAIVAGLILDIFSFMRVGINVFSFVIFCYFISFFSRRLIIEKFGGILIGTAFVSLMTFFHNYWIYFSDIQFKFSKILEIKFIFLELIGWKLIFNLIIFFISLLIFNQLGNKYSKSNNLILAK